VPLVRFGFMVKGKSVPLQAWTGPEGSRKLRFPDFVTSQDGGKVVSLTYRPSWVHGLSFNESIGTKLCMSSVVAWKRLFEVMCALCLCVCLVSIEYT